MRTWFIGLTAVALAAAIVTAEEKGTRYGAGVSLTTATPIADLATAPDKFLGTTVRVDGVVDAVCENMGCWMQLKDAASGRMVRIKVEDGVIVFPVSARGRRASAEGVFEKVDTAAEAAHHEATEKGAQAAASKVEAPHDHAAMMAAAAAKPHEEPPAVAYQIKATGAMVY